jgi:hypothetical protein
MKISGHLTESTSKVQHRGLDGFARGNGEGREVL